MISTRLIALPIVVAALAWPGSAVLAQAPGQIPGTLPPAPPIITPPPPVAPAPVPSVVTPLPQPRYGVPGNIESGPVISGWGGTVRSTYRGSDGYRAPKKKRPKRHRRPRVSSY
jgi:hypothetical protein